MYALPVSILHPAIMVDCLGDFSAQPAPWFLPGGLVVAPFLLNIGSLVNDLVHGVQAYAK